MLKAYGKFTALLCSAAIMLTSAGFSVFAADKTEITGVSTENGISITADISDSDSGKSAVAYFAVYNSGDDTLEKVFLKNTELSAGSNTITLSDSEITIDTAAEYTAAYLWDENQAPLCDVYKSASGSATPAPTDNSGSEPTPAPTDNSGSEPTPAPTDNSGSEPTPAPTDSSEATPTTAPTDEPITEGYVGTFVTDGHASITVSKTQSFDGEVEENVTTAIARSSDTGEIDTDGTGQINFLVVLDDGYAVDSVTAEPAGSYKNIKDSSDTGVENAYRITKITGDITITVTTKEATDATATPIPTDDPDAESYTGTFVTDGHASITVSKTQSFDGEVEENVTSAPARNKSTGAIDTSGEGQINFLVVLDDGYAVDSVTVEPSGNYKNIKGSEDTGVENAYRITKITGDITITVTTKEATDATDTPSDATYENTINLNGDTVESLADPADVSVDGTTVTITSAGEYNVTGSLADGQIAVKTSSSTDEVTLNLTDVSVTNSSLAPFSASEGIVTLLCSGTNTFTDTDAATTDTTIDRDNACVYSKRDLTIKAQDGADAAELIVNGNYNNGIRTKADLEIGNCDVTVNAANNGIKGDESVKLTKKAGTINITSGGDGIKTDYISELSGTVVSGGTITINGGIITIDANSTTEEDGTTSNGDGIQADYQLIIANSPKITIDALGDGLKANASSVDTDEPCCEDGDGMISVSGGEIDITAGEDGIKAVKSVDISGGTVTVKQALDGIQVNEIIYTDENKTTVSAYVAGAITISGGTVNVTSTEDGIQCETGTVTISDGTVTIKSTLDGIQGDNYVNITGGTVNITSGGGAPSGTASSSDTSTKGIKGGNLVQISGGTVTISSYDDAIHSNNTVRISGGDVTAASGDDGVHGDYYLYISDDANINVTKSYEGIEAAKIYVQGGNSYVIASDDGANAAGTEPTDQSEGKTLDNSTLSISSESETSDLSALAGPGGNNPGGGNNGNWGGGNNPGGEDTSSYGYLEMSGGLLYIDAAGDGFDSNGNAVVTGGTLLVNQTGNGNGVFDVGDNNNTLTITGGIVVGAGTSDMAETPTSTTNSQAYVCASGSSSSGNQGGMGGNNGWGGNQGGSTSVSGSAGQAFKLTNSSGTEILTYVPSESYQWVLISTPELTSGTSYTLSYGGTATGGTFTYGSKYGIATNCTYSGSSSVSLTAKTSN